MGTMSILASTQLTWRLSSSQVQPLGQTADTELRQRPSRRRCRSVSLGEVDAILDSMRSGDAKGNANSIVHSTTTLGTGNQIRDWQTKGRGTG